VGSWRRWGRVAGALAAAACAASIAASAGEAAALADVCAAMRDQAGRIRDLEVKYDVELGRLQQGAGGAQEFEAGASVNQAGGAPQFHAGHYGQFGCVWKEKGEMRYLDERTQSLASVHGGGTAELSNRTVYGWNGQEGRTFTAPQAGLITAKPSGHLRDRAMLPWLFSYRIKAKPDQMMSLPEYFESSGAQLSATREDVDGTPCVVVTVLTTGGGRAAEQTRERFWLDPSRGFGMLRYVKDSPKAAGMTIHGQPVQSPVTTIDGVTLQEVAPKAWYPAQWTVHAEDGGASRYRAESVKVNQGLPDSDFVVEFPPGTSVLDDRTDKRYVVPGAAPKS
jgi:hypothetical protein